MLTAGSLDGDGCCQSEKKKVLITSSQILSTWLGDIVDYDNHKGIIYKQSHALLFGSHKTSLIIWIGKPAPKYSVSLEKRDDAKIHWLKLKELN